jgi:hypothetical protein
MSEINRRGLLAGTAAIAGLGALPTRSARAQAANTIRIGVLNDQSGPYRDISGPYGVQCTLQAVAGVRCARLQRRGHQRRPPEPPGCRREHRAAVVRPGRGHDPGRADLSVGLAVNGVAREKNKAYINTGSATSDLTGAQCSPNTVHWMYDTYMLAKSTGAAMVRAGGDSWFFITADYAFGHALERDTGNFVRNAGGRVLGSVRYPFPATSDFSSFLVQAQASRAKVIGFANAGADTINSIKQAAEFGITRRGTKLAALLMFLPDSRPTTRTSRTSAASIARQWYDARRRRDHRRADLLGGARGLRSRREKNKVQMVNSGRRHLRPHQRAGLLAQHGALDLRHLRAGQRHRRRHREGGRRHLVLPHRRLRLRPRARARHSAVVKNAGGKVLGAVRTRSRAPTSRPSCSRRSPRARRSIGLANAGGDTINSIKQAYEFGISGRPEARRPPRLRDRRPQPRPRDRPRAWYTTEPSTGTRTTRPAPSPSASPSERRQDADHGPGRRLLGVLHYLKAVGRANTKGPTAPR